MPNQTQIDTAQIRAESVQIEELAHEIANKGKVLREKFDALYINLKFSPPLKDGPFDRYMCAIAQVIMLCDQAPSVAYLAREMQSYGKQQPIEDVSNLNRITPAAPAVACSCGGNAVAGPE
jgi:hypothetical protein